MIVEHHLSAFVTDSQSASFLKTSKCIFSVQEEEATGLLRKTLMTAFIDIKHVFTAF